MTVLPFRPSLFISLCSKDAIMNPSAALQSTVEDFLDSLKESPGAAQAEIVNCILRACGCNDTVNEDEAVDYDGVVDALDNFTEALKQVRCVALVLFSFNISCCFSGRLAPVSAYVKATHIQEISQVALRIPRTSHRFRCRTRCTIHDRLDGHDSDLDHIHVILTAQELSTYRHCRCFGDINSAVRCCCCRR